MDVDGEEVVEGSDALDASDAEGIESETFTWVLDLKAVVLRFFSGALDLGLGDDFAVLYAGPFDALFSFAD